MDTHWEERLARVIARRREHVHVETLGDEPGKARRMAHERIVSELPRLAAKIASAVAVLNDRLLEDSIALKVEFVDHTPASEASYSVLIAGAPEESPALVLTIDHQGVARGMIKTNKARTVLLLSTVFELDIKDLMDMLVTLLETYYR